MALSAIGASDNSSALLQNALAGPAQPPFRPDCSAEKKSLPLPPMNASAFNLGTVLLAGSGLFCLATLFFGTKGGYYDSDDYDGNGTAH